MDGQHRIEDDCEPGVLMTACGLGQLSSMN